MNNEFYIPESLQEQIIEMGRVEWGATEALTEAKHLEHLASSLKATREHFNFEDIPVRMHGVYLEGTDIVLCHTGTSPNSPTNAQIIAGVWNWLVDICEKNKNESK